MKCAVAAHGMQGFWKSLRINDFAFPLRRACARFWLQQGTALTRKTRFSMRHSRVIERKNRSSAAEGEALPGYGKQQRILNEETGIPTRLSDEPPQNDRWPVPEGLPGEVP
jgi:hypothetical protein